ncbi:MAG: hypothetical protein JNM01_12445 [Delftia acidovorans]|nr:hypothetical protein [Delftia acidovorans]
MAGDANYESVSLLLHGDGANGSTTFVDSGPRPKTPVVYGNTQISTAWSVFGGASMRFDGNGDLLSYPDHADLRFGGGDFSIECRLRLLGYPTSSGGEYGSAILAKDVGGAREWNLFLSGTASSFTTLIFQGYSSNTASVVVSIPFAAALNTDYAIAVARRGNLLYVLVNGVLLNPGGTAFAVTMRETATPMKVGALYFDGGATYNYYLNGFIDELRITKGVARHTANYALDTVAFANQAGQISGVVRDDTDAPAVRLVRGYYRDTGALAAESSSSVGSGAYTLNCKRLAECSVLFLDDAAGTVYNDKVLRVMPG